MKSPLCPSTEGSAGSGAEAQTRVQAEYNWSYKKKLLPGLYPRWKDLAVRGVHAGSTFGAHSRTGTRSLDLVCGIQMAVPSK